MVKPFINVSPHAFTEGDDKALQKPIFSQTLTMIGKTLFWWAKNEDIEKL